MKLLKRIYERALRLLMPALHRKVGLLEWQVQVLQKGLDFALEDDWCRWLYLNRAERMDATVDFFDSGRRRFHLDRYLFAAQNVKNLDVADIASGTGYGTELLLTTGSAASVVGIDIDRGAIDYARNKHMRGGVRYECASGDATGLENASLNVIVSFETIEHVPDDRNLIAEFSRLLKPSGRLICSTPNRWPLELAEHHVREYDETSFRNILEYSFTVDEMYNQNSGMLTAPFNRGQPAGIVATNSLNSDLAECFIAVCTNRNPLSPRASA
jgi:SAM-dependent methyltransferase